MSTKHWQTFLVFESMVVHDFSLAGKIWVTILLNAPSTLALAFNKTITRKWVQQISKARNESQY